MKQFTLNLIFIIPILGLIAGLSLGITIPLFMMASLYLIKDSIKISFAKFKLELAFFLLLALSCFWSLNPVISFLSCLKVFSLAMVTYILITKTKHLLNKISLQGQILTTTILGAIILFYIEFISDGAISLWFRGSFQNKPGQEFYLHYLDRGCALLALFAWVVIAQLLQSKKSLIAFFLYAITAITLGISDSLAAFLGFLISGVVFILTKYSFFKNPKILSLILGISSIAFVFMAINLDPYQLSKDAESLPISAKHRLFIWDFTATQAMEKPILGWGHGASRQIEVPDSAMINYQGYSLQPLPTHPHNNLMQILLENGIIGLILYISLACKYLFKWHDLFAENDLNKSNIQAAGYACFVTFFIISMISFNMWQSWWMCSFLWVAILFALIQKSTLKKI
ncbi:MAG: O-antigen ligase family protein [Rickettsiaceae bacterium]|nr:O-antigen ligase family protein [Rickettsiaceae bacterium]